MEAFMVKKKIEDTVTEIALPIVEKYKFEHTTVELEFANEQCRDEVN